MCGIIACRTATPAAAFLTEALSNLEYRGYDSAGVAVLTSSNGCAVIRSVNRVDDLVHQVHDWSGDPLGSAGIGHTRWATHGAVTEANAHPHVDCTGHVTIVHNGIIENADALRGELRAVGHEFFSTVDSEVISHLIEDLLGPKRDLLTAMQLTVARLRGSWAIVAMDALTGRIVGASHGSPLVHAESDFGAFLCSDSTAIARWAQSFRALSDGDVVELSEEATWTNAGVARALPELWVSARPNDETTMEGYSDFMQKEIDEQPEVAARIIDELATGIPRGTLWRQLGDIPFSRVAVIGCGTSLNAGTVIAQAFGRLGGVPWQPLVASECNQALEPGTLVIALSQSGETADILRAVDHVRTHDLPIIAVTNNEHSSLARQAASIVPCHAGVEIGVAATKTFTAQVVTGVCLAVSALVARGTIDRSRALALADELRQLPDLLAQSISVSKDVIPALAATLVPATGFVFLGRGSGVVYAAEGALKLKELTYRWAEAYPAGELKHGPLALVEQGTPVVVIDNGDHRLEGNIAEVRARGGRIIRIGRVGSTIPALGRGMSQPLPGGNDQWGPLESVVPVQVLARELALALGRDVDKPRNLAKSVTVD